jgi:hypothetical protein
MAIKRIRIDYTVYPPNHQSGEPCRDFRTFERAKKAARALGPGSRVYRNFNQANKRECTLGDWWGGNRFWTWNGTYLVSAPDGQVFTETESPKELSQKA